MRNFRIPRFRNVIGLIRISQSFVIVFFLLLIAVLSTQDFTRIKHRVAVVDSGYLVIGEITKTTPIIYEFNHVEADPLIGIRLEFANFVRENDCLINIYFSHGTKELINREIKCQSLPNNQFVELKIMNPERYKKEFAKYILTISTPDGIPGNALTMYRTEKATYPMGILTHGNKVLTGDLNIELIYGY